ncbi:MAG TPA: hypothetical protein VHY79_10985 [Rhizomicrobium sp.]|jgi:hypothetical protein|nr:hypothetical protein [Rhizomicrobium sp.]
MKKSLDQQVIPPAAGKKSSKADFDRNRDGLYGGLPKTRDPAAAGPYPNQPHPEPDKATQGHLRDQPRK